LKATDADLVLNAASAWIGPVRAHRILRAFGSSEAALKAETGELSAAAGRLQASQAKAFKQFCQAFDPAAEQALAEEAGARVLRFNAPAYPQRLAELPNPPLLLYVQGQLPAPGEPCVAIVGTRDPSAYGRRMAKRLAEGLAKAGVWVISGLAKGIDTEAQEACVSAGGRTVGVLGCGLADGYPPWNKELRERILATGGAVVSQFSMKARPEQKHFPMRNGIISGLSRGVIVVEGEEDSGSLITADWALEQGREVFAVPGSVEEPMAQGPLKLLQSGARLVRDAQDVLDELGLAPAKPRTRTALIVEPDGPAALDPGLDPSTPAGKVWRALGAGPRNLDQLSLDSGLAPSELAAVVTELELLGAVKALPGARLERS
jgi:DNA processing protein